MAWMGSMASVAAITALNTTNYEDGIAFHAIAEKLWLGLNKTSTDTANNTSVWAAVPAGRWHLIGSAGGSGSTVTVSSSAPGAIQPSGTVYIWTEDSSSTYSSDVEGRYPDSVITYVSNGSTWVTTSANKIFYADNPNNVGKLPNDMQEEWADISDPLFPVYYRATINSSSQLSWIQS